MHATVKPRSPIASPTPSTRGDARRQRLRDAATTLLGRLDLADVSYVAVCIEAGIPTGSAHHFYPDLESVYQALVAELSARHDVALYRPLRKADLASWQAAFRCLVRRSERFMVANPVFAKLVLSGQAPPELKRLDREADRARGQYFLALLAEHFVVPRISDPARVAHLATEIIDTAFMLSMSEAGRITPTWFRHALAAGEAFLTLHLGETLHPRPSGPAMRAAATRRKSR